MRWPCDFAKLTEDQWRRCVHVLLSAIPQGLSAGFVRALLGEALPEQLFSAAAVDRLHTIFVDRICPELSTILEDDTVRRFANHEGTDDLQIFRRLLAISTITLDSAGAAVRNVLAGKRRDKRVIYALTGQEQAADVQYSAAPEIKPLEGRLAAWPVTLLGCVGRPAYGNEAVAVAYLEHADAIRKMFAYELVAAGFTVVAMSGDEFLVEVDSDAHFSLDDKIRSAFYQVQELLRRYTPRFDDHGHRMPLPDNGARRRMVVPLVCQLSQFSVTHTSPNIDMSGEDT